MSQEAIFQAVNAGVLPAWASLLLLPRWRHTQKVAWATITLLCAVYVGLIAYAFVTGGGAEGVDFTTMEGVAAIFSAPLGINAGWTHFLAFDLFVGAWIGRDARARSVPHWLAAPCQVLSFLAGPSGLLLYLGVRAAHRLR